jgi:hypothetical protein
MSASPTGNVRSRALAQLTALLRHASSELGARTPSWAPAALAAFVAGVCVAAAASLLSARRRWSAAQLRLHRATPVLKDIVRAAWTELDAEDSGWLEASEARAVLDSVLQTLQLPQRTQQLAALIAPPALPSSVFVSDDSSTPPSSSWSPVGNNSGNGADASASSAAAAAAAVAANAALLGSQAPAAADVELEVRAALGRLWPSLRRHLAREYKFFLAHVEARPPPSSSRHHRGNFTPPANFRSPATSHEHSPLMHQQQQQQQQRRHAHSAAAASSTSTASSGSSPPLSATASAGSASTAAEAAAAASSGLAPSPSPSAAAAATEHAVSFDGRMFRCEFNTALVIWLEAKIAQQLLSADQTNDAT